MLGRILSSGHLRGNVKRQFQKNSWVQQGVAFRQGWGLFHHEGLIRGIFHCVFFHQGLGGLTSGFFHGVGGWWSLISGFSHQGCLSLVFCFFSLGGVVVFRQGGLSSGWCLIKAVFCQGLHCVVFLMCGCKPNMSDQSGLSRSPAYWIFEVWL